MEMFHEFFFSNLILVSLCVINKYRENGTGKNLKKYMFFLIFRLPLELLFCQIKEWGFQIFQILKHFKVAKAM